MNRVLAAHPGLEFQGNGPNFVERGVGTFLARFDAIFTLNQDLVLELFYTGDLRVGVQYPGMRVPPAFWGSRPNEKIAAEWQPRPEGEYGAEQRAQPIFKLHGSTDLPPSVGPTGF